MVAEAAILDKDGKYMRVTNARGVTVDIEIASMELTRWQKMRIAVTVKSRDDKEFKTLWDLTRERQIPLVDERILFAALHPDVK